MNVDKPIVIAVTLFVILLLAFFLVYPEYQRFKTLQEDLGIKRAEYNAEFEYYSEISRQFAQLKSQAENVAKVDAALPSDSKLGPLVYYLQEQATKSGLVFRSLFLSKSPTSTAKNTVKELTFSLNLSGNYTALGTFIGYLENSSRIFEIENINFGMGETSALMQSQFRSESIYAFTLQVKTHTY